MPFGIDSNCEIVYQLLQFVKAALVTLSLIAIAAFVIVYISSYIGLLSKAKNRTLAFFFPFVLFYERGLKPGGLEYRKKYFKSLLYPLIPLLFAVLIMTLEAWVEPSFICGDA